MSRSLVLAALCVTAVMSAAAQPVRVGTWKTFTSHRTARAVTPTATGVAVATSGGLFTMDASEGPFDIVTNTSGLLGNDLTAVGIDRAGRLWAGGAAGELSVRENGVWRSLDDIAQTPRLQKAIRRFVSKGDTVFIVSDFGVSVFRTDRWEFADTYANFGYPSTLFGRDAVVRRDTVWVASASGLAAASLNHPNLSSPSAWSLVPSSQLASGTVHSLAVLRDTLYIGTANGLTINGGSGFVAAGFGGKDVRRLVTSGGSIVVLSLQPGSASVDRLAGAVGPATPAAPPYMGTATDVAVWPDGMVLSLAAPGLGSVTNVGGSWVRTVPDAPGSNRFHDLAIDPDGQLWAGTGISGGGEGFMRFRPDEPEGRRWKTFTRSEYPVMVADDWYKVDPADDGSVWVSSWGLGMVQVRGDSIVRKIDVNSVPPVASSVSVDPTYAVMGGAARDAAGSVWMTNRTAVTGNVLVSLRPDDSMAYYRNLLPAADGRFASLVIDGNGTKWLANSEPVAKASTGLHYFHENMVVAGTAATGGWGVLTQADGIANNTVMCVTIDADGDVWAGTDLGVVIITNLLNPRSGRQSSFPLREQSVQTIAVDALDRKWAGTKEGVFVVSPDGSQLVQHFTKRNTGGLLVDDDVRTIAIDNRRGIVYMGTEGGMSALWIAAVETQRRFTTLTVAPNPYLIPSGDALTISGLVANAALKVLRIDGTLVRAFDAQGGGRAFWDGTTEQGDLVGSGTYLIVAFAGNGEQVATGKVAVVRR